MSSRRLLTTTESVKRAKHFDRDGDPERNSGQREVEAQVHHRQRARQRRHRQTHAFRDSPQHACGRTATHNTTPATKKPHEHRADRAQRCEQADGERGADLLAHRGHRPRAAPDRLVTCPPLSCPPNRR